MRVLVQKLNINNQDNSNILNQVIAKLLNFIVLTNNLDYIVINICSLVFKDYSLR